MALKGVRVAGLYSLEELENGNQALESAAALGATIENDYDKVDVFIAETVLSEAYMEMIRSGVRKPVVTRAWLAACAQAQQQLPTTQHLLGPFAGLRVCMTGFTDSKTRTSLPEAIQKGGGKYTADMFKNSTHLVAKTRDSEKYKHALNWGTVKMVSAAWVFESQAAGLRLDEDLYPVPQKGTQQQQQQPSHQARQSNSAVPRSTNEPTGSKGAATRAASTSQAAAQGKAPSSAGKGRGRSQEQPREGGNRDASPAGIGMQEQGGRATRSRAAAAAAPPAGPAAPKQPSAVHAHPGLAAAPAATTGLPPSCLHHCQSHLFLADLRLHGLGLSGSERVEMQRLVCDGGAVREPELGPRVTHVLLGSEVSVTDLQLLREKIIEAREEIQVVNGLGWLRGCCLARAYAPPAQEELVSLAALKGGLATAGSMGAAGLLGNMASMHGGPTASLAQPPGMSRLMPAKLDFADLTAAAEASNLMPAISIDSRSRLPSDLAGDGEGWQMLPGPENQRLANYWFTLAAVAGTALERQAEELIRARGGLLVHAASAYKLRDKPDRLYAICPYSLPDVVTKELERRAEDFKMVPKQRRVTLYWVERCVTEGYLIPVPVAEEPLMQPIPYMLPLQPFPTFRIYISGCRSPAQKRSLQLVAEVLGATVQQNMDKTCTHLLLVEFTSEAHSAQKYTFALRAGMTVVGAGWLLNSVYYKRVFDMWAEASRPLGETDAMRQEQQRALEAHKQKMAQRAAAGVAALPSQAFGSDPLLLPTQFGSQPAQQQVRQPQQPRAPSHLAVSTQQQQQQQQPAFEGAPLLKPVSTSRPGHQQQAPLPTAPQQQQQQQPDAPPPLVLQPIDSNVPPCHVPDKSSGAGCAAAAGKTGSQPSRNSQGGPQPKQLAGPQSGAGQSEGGQEQPRGAAQAAITLEAVTAAVVAQQVPLEQRPGSQGQDAQQQQQQQQQGPDRLSGAGVQAQQQQEPCQQAPGVPPSHSEQPLEVGAPAVEPPPPALPVRDGSSDEGQEQLAAQLAELMARLPRGAAPVAPLDVTASQLDPLLVAGLSAATAAAAGRSNPGSAATTPRAARPPLAGGGGGRPPVGPAAGACSLAGAGASSALVSGGVSHNSGSDFGSKGQEGEAMSHMGPPSGRTGSTRRTRGTKRGSGGGEDAQGPGGDDAAGLQAGVRKSARVGTRAAAGSRGLLQHRLQEDAGPGVAEMSQQVGYDAGQRPAERLTSRMRSRAGAAAAGAGEKAGAKEPAGGRLKEQLITCVLQGAAGAGGTGDQGKQTDTLHALMDML